jgi:hypothetical protein
MKVSAAVTEIRYRRTLSAITCSSYKQSMLHNGCQRSKLSRSKVQHTEPVLSIDTLEILCAVGMWLHVQLVEKMLKDSSRCTPVSMFSASSAVLVNTNTYYLFTITADICNCYEASCCRDCCSASGKFAYAYAICTCMHNYLRTLQQVA